MKMIHHHCRFLIIAGIVFSITLTPLSCFALEPGEILIVANKNSPQGVGLAHYYAKRRHIPKDHLILLNLPIEETCKRDVYERQVAEPVRAFLTDVNPSWRIRCLVLMYGIPLKVAPPNRVVGEKDVDALRYREKALEELLDARNDGKESEKMSALAKELDGVRTALNRAKIDNDWWASVDSELSVVRKPDAPIGGWIDNPFYIGFRNRPPSIPKEKVLMVSRLDGPDSGTVRRIIDDTLDAEKTGLKGTACFDARWPKSESPPGSGYEVYDRSIHNAAQLVKNSGRMPVVLDHADALFQSGQCPDAALYCGWYSLATYVDAFKWQKGAVGFHIASSECTTLKKKNSQVWCKRMIEEGVCATVGPVGEPYVQAFPMPELFFGFLTEGVLSLVECYMVSLPFLSWKMVLIGDPLYHPFTR